MNYVLVINAAVSLIMGCALVLVGWRDRTQSFTLYIGWASLVQLLVPLAYLLKSQGQGIYAEVGGFALAVVAAVYSTLLLTGTSHLANRPVPRSRLWLVLALLAVVNATAIGLGGLRVSQTCMAIVNTGLGLVCTYWLLSAGTARSISEKLVGPLLVSLGLIQFIFVIYGDAGATLLAALGALLRLTLGLVLFYAALDRGAAAAVKLQNRFERLTERSHQAIMISFGDSSIVYANPACLALYGVGSLEQLRVATVARTIPKEERIKVGRILSEIQHGQADDASYEALRYRADGTPMWLRCHYFRTEWDGAHAVQVLITDDTARHRGNEALLYQAMHDELTGLPNRAAMIRSLHKRCDPARANDQFVLVLMNIDRFKLFNEAPGW